ncbi:hypothetical protein LTR28_007258, partial [Elasticomyces elasticus]
TIISMSTSSRSGVCLLARCLISRGWPRPAGRRIVGLSSSPLRRRTCRVSVKAS